MNQREFSPCHYTLTLQSSAKSPLSCETAYPLYAALLERGPSWVGEALHREGLAPMSQYLQISRGKILWHVHLFSPDLVEQFAPILENTKEFSLRQTRLTLSVEALEVLPIPTAEAFFQQAAQHSGKHTFQVVTPTAFKSRGNYIALPTSHLLLQSLMRKWNVCFPDSQIEDEDGEGLLALSQGLWLHEFALHSEKYSLKRQKISGFVGELTASNHLQGMQRQVVDALLLFAPYVGFGIKTTLGMGGVRAMLST